MIVEITDDNSEIKNINQVDIPKTEIGKLVECLRNDKIDEAKQIYEEMAADWNKNKRIGLFVHLFIRVNQHWRILYLMGIELSAAEIRYAYRGLSVDQIDFIHKK